MSRRQRPLSPEVLAEIRAEIERRKKIVEDGVIEPPNFDAVPRNQPRPKPPDPPKD